MKRKLSLITLLVCITAYLQAQMEPAAGQWKTWFISSGKEYRLSPPSSSKSEIEEVLSVQKAMDSSTLQQILYWGAGSPSYRWQSLMMGNWMNDTTYNGPLAYMLLGVATYDATIVAWDTKYAYKKLRPFEADKRIKVFGPKPESPTYPCEYSVAAGVAVEVFGHFYPLLADSVDRMAQRGMAARVASGMAFPSDTKAGYELGRLIARKEIEKTKGYVPQKLWDGKRPDAPGTWKGKPMAPLAGLAKTIILDSSSQFRPGPPPEFAKDMEELKKFKPGFRSSANAFFWASQSFWDEQLNKKIFEQNLHLNPPRAAFIYAVTDIAMYDGFAACWDAKYTYWGIRPDQYDTTFHPVLIYTPPFPGYPSGHAVISSTMAEIYSYFFPADKAFFQKKAKEAAESRFQGGIHFRTDNEVGLELGRKVGNAIIQKIRKDGPGNW